MDEVTRMAEWNLRDRDGAVVLHTLRLCKWVAKHDPSKRREEDDGGGTSNSCSPAQQQQPSPFMPLWNLLIRPRCLEAVESRRDPNLEALVCDVISEVGEATFDALTKGQRSASVCYVLCRCHEERAPQVRASAFRALGLLLGFR